jgi:hypothetical protein
MHAKRLDPSAINRMSGYRSGEEFQATCPQSAGHAHRGAIAHPTRRLRESCAQPSEWGVFIEGRTGKPGRQKEPSFLEGKPEGPKDGPPGLEEL